VPSDTNLNKDIYRKDTLTGAVELISVALGGPGGDDDSLLTS